MNKVLGGKNGIVVSKSYKEPAGLFAWRWVPIVGLWSFAIAFAGYAKFVKGYNILWFVAPFAPLWTYILYNWAR